jgi:hypothetical protein
MQFLRSALRVAGGAGLVGLGALLCGKFLVSVPSVGDRLGVNGTPWPPGILVAVGAGGLIAVVLVGRLGWSAALLAFGWVVGALPAAARLPVVLVLGAMGTWAWLVTSGPLAGGAGGGGEGGETTTSPSGAETQTGAEAPPYPFREPPMGPPDGMW